MYESLVIGRSFMIESCSSCKTFFFADLAYSQGEHDRTL